MRSTLLAAAIAALLAPGIVLAQLVPANTLPTLANVRAGSAVVTSNAAAQAQTINQTSPRAVIDWNDFSIGKTATVSIVQQSAQSVLLNRVVGVPGAKGPIIRTSFIEGTLRATGRVFILNSAGVLFGADAQVNVGGLLASALDLADNTATGINAFLTATSLDLAAPTTTGPTFFPPELAGRIVVLPASSTLPQIQAGPGGEVLLIGNAPLSDIRQVSLTNLPGISQTATPLIGSVTHAGNIATQGGRVHLAAGDSATLQLPVGNSGFVTLSLVGAKPTTPAVGVVAAPGSVISNPGGSVTLQAVSQNTLGTASGLGSIDGGGKFVSNFADGIAVTIADGTISARNDTAQPISSVSFLATGASTLNLIGGNVDVTGSTPAASGGIINAGAQYVGLLTLSTPATTPVLDASGASGGGTITLGGNTTRLLQITEPSQVLANATVAGDGGRIVLDATYFNATQPATPVAVTDFGVASLGGRFEATGRGNGHLGGTVLSSGAALNIAAASVDASGANGATQGQWTIDSHKVSISNDPTVAVTVFAPTGPDASIRVADVGAGLDTGTNVVVSTGTGGPPFAGTITVANNVTVQRSAGAAPVALTLAAADSVVMQSGSRITSSAGPLDVNLFANRDGNGGGVRISGGGASIATRGGNVLLLGGGFDPLTGVPRGNPIDDAGVDLLNAAIDTRGNGVVGNVTMRGVGYIGTGYDTPGVRIRGTTVDANNVSVIGNSGNNDGVQLGAGARITTSAGTIDIRGMADPANSIAGDASIGVNVGGSAQLLAGSGALRLAGRGAAVGALVGDVLVASADNAGSAIVIAGESFAGTRPGIELAGTTTGLEIRGSSGGNAFSGANVVIGAKAGAGAADAIGTAGSAAPRMLTHGYLNLRPLGIDGNGAFVEDVATPIYVGNAPNFATSPATNFIVRSPWLTPVAGAAPGATADAGTVIGSSLERGRITLDNAAPIGGATLRLSLQNEGAGSAGIAVGANLAAASLGVFSSSDVVQTAPLGVGQLLVRGGSASNVDFGNAANRIAAVAFDPPNSLTVRTQGDLTIGGPYAAAFDAASGAFATVAPTTSQAGARALLQSLDGSLILAQPITMLGANSQLDLVAATLFQNPAAAQLASGAGGAWHVWSDTWQGSARGGLAGTAPLANLYGCAFGDVAICSLSGFAIPPTGDRFYYRAAPAVIFNGLTGPVDFRDLIQSQRSDIYGVNFSLPNVCTATSSLGDTPSEDPRGAPPLAIEWSRVRNQPQLSSCQNLREAGDCAPF